MEAMPLIQKLLQRNDQGPRTDVHSDTSASSFPQSAFLDALAAFRSLPDFEQRLSTVNGHGQSLLHLAVHLRYPELVQRLVDWGVDLKIKDVNGFTALDAANLCNDASLVHILEKTGVWRP
jgi:ankyrin repeat protein